MDFLKGILDKITNRFSVQIRLFQLDVVERSARVLGAMAMGVLIMFVSLGLLFFVGLGMAEWMSYVLDSRIGGYFAAAGLFLIFLIVLFVWRKKFTSKAVDFFILLLTDKNTGIKRKEEQMTKDLSEPRH